MRLRNLHGIGLACILVGRTQAQAPAHDLQQLRWLGGCWELHAASRLIHEQWMAPLGGLMLGMARTVVNGTVREFEQVRIELRQGVPTYVANPSRQEQAAFAAVQLTDSSVLFRNPQHDFPTEVGYRRIGADSLLAYIAGVQAGKPVTVKFPMKRSSCG